ncbi:MAG: hypothetical protein HYU97_00560 [Deltaproteobacteria bacterium]|nr:hypothetical protein [Deltaproteobacteria bacterium]
MGKRVQVTDNTESLRKLTANIQALDAALAAEPRFQTCGALTGTEPELGITNEILARAFKDLGQLNPEERSAALASLRYGTFEQISAALSPVDYSPEDLNTNAAFAFKALTQALEGDAAALALVGDYCASTDPEVAKGFIAVVASYGTSAAQAVLASLAQRTDVAGSVQAYLHSIQSNVAETVAEKQESKEAANKTVAALVPQGATPIHYTTQAGSDEAPVLDPESSPTIATPDSATNAHVSSKAISAIVETFEDVISNNRFGASALAAVNPTSLAARIVEIPFGDHFKREVTLAVLGQAIADLTGRYFEGPLAEAKVFAERVSALVAQNPQFVVASPASPTTSVGENVSVNTTVPTYASYAPVTANPNVSEPAVTYVPLANPRNSGLSDRGTYTLGFETMPTENVYLRGLASNPLVSSLAGMMGISNLPTAASALSAFRASSSSHAYIEATRESDGQGTGDQGRGDGHSPQDDHPELAFVDNDQPSTHQRAESRNTVIV